MMNHAELFDVHVIKITKSERRPRIFGFKSRLYVEGQARAIPYLEADPFVFDFSYEGAVDEDSSVMLNSLREHAAYHYNRKVVRESSDSTLESYIARLGGEKQNG